MDFTTFIDNVVNAGAQIGDQLLTNAAKQQLGASGTSAHIQAQNQTVAAFAQILNEYNAKTISAQQAVDLITRYNQGFMAFCQKLGYARAIRGAGDVNNLAVKILTTTFAGVTPSALTSSAPPGTLPPVPTGVTLPPGVLPAGIASLGNLSPLTLALLVGAGFLLMRSKRVF